jgi:hypothetical protein
MELEGEFVSLQYFYGSTSCVYRRRPAHTYSDRFYDPPYALTSVSALLAPTSTIPASPASTSQFVSPPTNVLFDTAPSSSTSPLSPQDPQTVSGTQLNDPTTSSQASMNPDTSNPNGNGNEPSSQGSPDGPQSQGHTSVGLVSQTPPPIIIGTSTINPNSASQYIIGTQTLSPGGPAITTSGNIYSLAPLASGGSLVINGVTQLPSTPIITGAPLPATTGAALVIGGSTITANSASQFVVGSQTLAPGGSALTVNGTTFSLPATGSVVVVNGVTTALGMYTTTGANWGGGGGVTTGGSASGTSHVPVTLNANAASSSRVAVGSLVAAIVAVVGELVIDL